MRQRQILTFLYFLGQPGCTVSKTREKGFVGYGTQYLYLSRAVETNCSFLEKLDFGQILTRERPFQSDWGASTTSQILLTWEMVLFLHWHLHHILVTLLITQEKNGYSITCFIINDDKIRIMTYSVGWPVSLYDNKCE